MDLAFPVEIREIARMRTLLRGPRFFLLLALITPMVLRAADEPETPLGEQMEKMKTEMKALRADLEAPSEARKDQYVKRARNFHAAAVAARKFDPDKTKTLPEAERAGFVSDYQKAMDKLIKNSEELEKMLASGNWDAANRQLKVMGKEQKAGHKEFRVDKD